jgi:DNA mismatch endonuclease (patch repair protein)
MARVRSRDSSAEMKVRRLLHSLGYRYRLHDKRLPGKPDLSFPGRRKAIFVHGCFWHRHPDPACKLARMPKSRLEYWAPKLEANRLRDARNLLSLSSQGWQPEIVWECELRTIDRVRERLAAFLGPAKG